LPTTPAPGSPGAGGPQSTGGPSQSDLTLDPALIFQEQGKTQMQQMNLEDSPPGNVRIPDPARPGDKIPFFHDSKFGLQLRTFYFYRDKYDHSLSQAWAIGAALSYKSGYIADLLAIGAVVYTSQPLYAPADRDGSGLLAPGQEGYTVLGQAYAEFKLIDRVFFAIGRKSYETPFMNSNDARMTPNTFEGATLYGKVGGEDGNPEVRFGTGYIATIKPRNSEEFIWMSEAAGATADRGVIVAGANVDWKGLSIGAIDYYCEDVINIFYTEAKYTLLKGEWYKLNVAAQYADQRSLGESLTGAFFSGQWGVKADLSIGEAVLTAGFTQVVSASTNMQAPWSGYPGYTSVQVMDFNRANEAAVVLKIAYDFTKCGIKDVTAYALWVHGSGREAPNFNEDEYDLNVQWTPKDGWLKGTSVRVRYAYISQRGGGDPDINDFRVIINYDF
jgi:hypothetical protein